jgi:hypothetical protein
VKPHGGHKRAPATMPPARAMPMRPSVERWRPREESAGATVRRTSPGEAKEGTWNAAPRAAHGSRGAAGGEHGAYHCPFLGLFLWS